MDQRALGKTGRDVSVVGLGTWQLGADWGSVDESAALAVLDSAVEMVTCVWCGAKGDAIAEIPADAPVES